MSKAAYEVRASGDVPAAMLADFADATVTHELAVSTIRLKLADESEVHGLLDALRRGGFTLIEVRRDPAHALEEESSPEMTSPVDPPASP